MFTPDRWGTTYATATQLPLGMPRWSGGAGRVYAPYYPLPGGVAFNVLGSTAAKGLSEVRRYRCVAGYTSISNRNTALDAMNALVGRYDRLWTNDGTAQHWRYATITDLQIDVAANSPLYVEYDFELTFERGDWADGTTTDQSVTLNVSPKAVTLTNAGDRAVTNVIFNITAGSAPITALTVVNAGGTIKWAYSGTITAGQTLEVHCGGRWVKNNGSYDYTNFALDAALHKIADWMWLTGSTDTILTVTITGGSTDSTFRSIFNSGWST